MSAILQSVTYVFKLIKIDSEFKYDTVVKPKKCYVVSVNDSCVPGKWVRLVF